MNATYAPHPGYAVAPSPHPRQAAHDLTLIALHTAIRFSGLFAKFTAQRWGFRHLSGAAERVAAELITRAVETTGNPDPNPRYTDLDELRIIGIRVSVKGNGLLIEVWDSDPTPPQGSYLDNHLSTVAEISQQWNCYQPRGGGKVIWAELAVPQQRQTGELGFRVGRVAYRAVTDGGPRVIPASWPYSQGSYEAFAAMKKAGFTAYCCGDRHAPHVLVAAYGWEDGYMDVVNIRGANRVTAARLPPYEGLDIFVPSWAVWHHIGPLEPIVAAMLELPPPGHRDAPVTVYPAPLTLFVASHEQRPMTVKPGRHP